MRKTLLTFLLSTSLVIGANQLKGQETGHELTVYKNNDKDTFPERMTGGYFDIQGINELGITNVGYFDEDNDNFYEKIRVLNKNIGNSTKMIVTIEDFYIHKETGLIDYQFRKYAELEIEQWNNLFGEAGSCSNIFNQIVIIKNCLENIQITDQKFEINLTGQEFYEMGIDKRVKNLINAYKDKERLENMLKYERYLGRKRFEEKIEKMK